MSWGTNLNFCGPWVIGGQLIIIRLPSTMIFISPKNSLIVTLLIHYLANWYISSLKKALKRKEKSNFWRVLRNFISRKRVKFAKLNSAKISSIKVFKVPQTQPRHFSSFIGRWDLTKIYEVGFFLGDLTPTYSMNLLICNFLFCIF